MGRGKVSKAIRQYQKKFVKETTRKGICQNDITISYKGDLYLIFLENGLPTDVSSVVNPLKAGREPGSRECAGSIPIELRNEVIRHYYKNIMK